MKEQKETILDARSTKTFITRNPVHEDKRQGEANDKSEDIPTTKRGSDTARSCRARAFDCG